MEPVSAITITASTVTLVRLLGQGVLSVKSMLLGIRNVDDTTRGFGEELDAFQFSLTLLDCELRKGTLIPEIRGWWNPMRLDSLLINATKTFSRLEVIFSGIHRHRLVFQGLREYYCMTQCDQEIKHLRLRINTYTSSLNIPVVLLAIHSTRRPATQMDQNWSYSLLGDRISQLEQSINSISTDIKTFIVSQTTNDSAGRPQVESSTCRDSEELVNIARSLALSASSVAGTEITPSVASTVRAFDLAASLDAPPTPNEGNSPVFERENNDEGTDDSSLSIIGVPLSVPRLQNIDTWIQGTRTARTIRTDNSLCDNVSSMPSIASISLTETSQPSLSQCTPPSTIYSQGDINIEIEMIKRRYKKARDLMGEQKFGEAVPHLRRTLDVAKGASEGLILEDALRREEIQILLATALMKNNPTREEAEPILRELFESDNIKALERFSVAHLLAQLLLTLHPDDCSEAKSICLTAIKGRNSTLGRTDPKTYESIALLVTICQISNDSDEAIWRDMLPDKYEFPKLDRTAQLWDVATRNLLYKLADGFWVVAFSPDGKLFATGGGDDNTALLWDAATGSLSFMLEGHTSSVLDVALSPNCKLVVTGSCDSTARLWDAATGNFLYKLEGHSSHVCTVAFSPDSELVATGSEDGTARLWDTATGNLLHKLEGNKVAFSPDGKLVATGRNDGAVWLWHTDTGSLSYKLEDHEAPRPVPATAVAFSPDGKLVAVGYYHGIPRLWGTGQRNLSYKLEGHFSAVRAMAFSPDGKLVAAGCSGGFVKLWDVATRNLLCKLGGYVAPTDVSAQALAFSPDSKLVAAGSNVGTVWLWDSPTAKPLVKD